MNILLDMNLSPEWESYFLSMGIESSHWSKLGNPKSTDREIFNYARKNNFIIFTHDLDFSAMLTHSNSEGPSVIQVRNQNIIPEVSGEMILSIIESYKELIEQGVLIVIEELQHRIRILPLNKK
jgi:predicted nuclease of predicted toxin-antitoxin system